MLLMFSRGLIISFCIPFTALFTRRGVTAIKIALNRPLSPASRNGTVILQLRMDGCFSFVIDHYQHGSNQTFLYNFDNTQTNCVSRIFFYSSSVVKFLLDKQGTPIQYLVKVCHCVSIITYFRWC